MIRLNVVRVAVPIRSARSGSRSASDLSGESRWMSAVWTKRKAVIEKSSGLARSSQGHTGLYGCIHSIDVRVIYSPFCLAFRHEDRNWDP
jgi:hypothetical protein